MRRRSARPEDTIQRAVLAHLRQRGAPGLFFCHVPNGGKRRPIEASIMKGLGVVAGTPDLFLFRGGKPFALELKADTGRVTEVQERTHDALRNAGVPVAVAHGLDAALAQLESWQLLRGTTA